MKKIFALFLSIIMILGTLCLFGCNEPEETPWWKDTENMEIEILSIVPEQEKVLTRFAVDSKEHKNMENQTFHLETVRKNDQFLRYPFTTVKLYYKGVETPCYQQNGCYYKYLNNETSSDAIPGYFPGMYIPNEFWPKNPYVCTWRFYETSNTVTPSTGLQGKIEGKNRITYLEYNINLEYIYPEIEL